MARQEVGKVQEMLMSPQQEAPVEGESSENKGLSAQLHTVVGWNLIQWLSEVSKIVNISTTNLLGDCREAHVYNRGKTTHYITRSRFNTTTSHSVHLLDFLSLHFYCLDIQHSQLMNAEQI